jgi:hypothetical protein
MIKDNNRYEKEQLFIQERRDFIFNKISVIKIRNCQQKI